jgi:tripartite-type tricarboxylate transporter receptor subunit TctC
MRYDTLFRPLAFLVTALLLAHGHEARAQSPAEFYKGKTIRIVVGFAPGGGYDSYSRLLARHFGRFMPGHPDIIVSNMPGAGSLKAVQYVDLSGAKDGTVISAFDPGTIVQSMAEPAKFPFKAANYAWIGSISEDVRACYVWAQTGIKNWADLLKRDKVVFGEAGKGTAAYVDERILSDVFGVKVKQVIGYPGSADKRLAIERGELEGDCGSFSSLPAEWVRDKKINVVLRFSSHLAPGMTGDSPYAPDIAKDRKQKQLLEFLISSGDVGRPYVASKKVPKDRLAAQREAFAQVIQDPTFLADAEKQKLPVIDPKNWEETQKIVARLYKTPADVVAQAKHIMGGD